MACLFCLKILPKGKDHEFLEEKVTTENGGEFTLKISLKNPDKNLEAFNCLCTLLKVKWRSSKEDDDDEDSDKDNNQFDIRRPLPLCRRCQQGYQEIYQLHQQIKELEELMMGRAKVIKKTIADTETAGLRLTCEKLNEFRKMVMASPNSNLLDSSGADQLMSEQESDDRNEADDDDDDHDEIGQDLKLININPLAVVGIPIRIKSRGKKKKQSGRQIIKKLGKPNTTTTNCFTRSKSSAKIGLSSLSSSSLSCSSMSPRNDEDTTTDTSPLPATPIITTAPTPKKKRVGRQSKLERVTESTPRIHVDCFTCCYCGLRLKTTGGLSSHRKLHEPPTHGCPLCSKMFAIKYQMTRHLKGVHKNEVVPVTTAKAPAKVADAAQAQQ